MAFWNQRPQTPQERARQQIRDLSKAAVKKAKQVDKAYPDYDMMYRIQRDYERQAEMILKGPVKRPRRKLTKAERARIVAIYPPFTCDI
jgi:hypothetical protein